jgi:hypothetical protein
MDDKEETLTVKLLSLKMTPLERKKSKIHVH